MLDLSHLGLLGAFVGTAVAAAVYGPVVRTVERGFRARGPRPDEAANFERELAALRRVVLALDILLFAGLGYWLGTLIES